MFTCWLFFSYANFQKQKILFPKRMEGDGVWVKLSPLKTLGLIPTHPPITYATHMFPYHHCHASPILFNPTTITFIAMLRLSCSTLPPSLLRLSCLHNRYQSKPYHVVVSDGKVGVLFLFLLVLRTRLGLILGQGAEVGYQHRFKSVLS